MADPINNLITPPGTSNTQTNRTVGNAPEARQAPQDEQQQPATTSTDTVTLTEPARQLSELSSEAAAGEAVDIGRVETVRQSIDDGTYQIDSQQIAERLLALEDNIGA